MILVAKSRPQTSSPVLYSSPDSSSVVVDIPTSISLAQHLQPPPQHYPLISSSPAPTVPYQSTEPKTERAKANVLARNGGQEHGVTHERWLREAWDQLRREKQNGVWCLSRNVKVEVNSRRRKRSERQQIQSKWARKGTNREAAEDEDSNETYCLESKEPRILQPLEKAIDVPTDLKPLNLQDINERLVLNPASESVKLFTVSLDPLPTSATFLIPPRSSFFQGTINRDAAVAFSKAALKLHPCGSSLGAGPGEFDVVVLDPPWQNRSVRNSRKYPMMSEDGEDYLGPLHVLRDMLGKHLATDGIVACWITNKSIVRDLALQLFRHWAVELIEELVWLKVTTEGAPVLDIPSSWRKPYEICLIGKRGSGVRSNDGNGSVKRRLIVAVPDIHSRKPCLRDILRSNDTDHRGLEIFARSLTANWCAWGDQVLFSAEQGDWAFPSSHTSE